MPFAEYKGKTNTNIKPQSLSNVQMELIKLYSTDLELDELIELKKILANYYAEKAINEADEIWEQKGISGDTMEDWLNGN